MPYYDDAGLQGTERRQKDQRELALGLLASESLSDVTISPHLLFSSFSP